MIRPYWPDHNKALVKIVDKTFICFIYQVLLVRIQLGWKKIFCFVSKKQKWWYSHSRWCPILINTDSSMKLQKPTLSWKHTYWTQHFLYNKKKKFGEKKCWNIKYCIKISTYKMMPTYGLHSALKKKRYNTILTLHP